MLHNRSPSFFAYLLVLLVDAGAPDAALSDSALLLFLSCTGFAAGLPWSGKALFVCTAFCRARTLSTDPSVYGSALNAFLYASLVRRRVPGLTVGFFVYLLGCFQTDQPGRCVGPDGFGLDSRYMISEALDGPRFYVAVAIDGDKQAAGLFKHIGRRFEIPRVGRMEAVDQEDSRARLALSCSGTT